MKTIVVLVGILMLFIAGVIGFQFNQPPEPQPLGSVGGSPYNATSTAGIYALADIVLQEGYGTLGSVIVTGANTTAFEIYNATTTDKNKRTGQKATSSIFMAAIPASLAVGTYTFDTVFTDGLLIDVTTAGTGSTTITWK